MITQLKSGLWSLFVFRRARPAAIRGMLLSYQNFRFDDGEKNSTGRDGTGYDNNLCEQITAGSVDSERFNYPNKRIDENKEGGVAGLMKIVLGHVIIYK